MLRKSRSLAQSKARKMPRLALGTVLFGPNFARALNPTLANRSVVRLRSRVKTASLKL